MTLIFKTLIERLEQKYPSHLAESWDKVGLHFGDVAAPVKRVMAVLDLDDATLAEAIERNVDTLIVHHPPIFVPIARFDYSQPDIRRYVQLIQHGIKVFAMHTNLDIAWDGMNDWLAEAIGLTNVESLTPGKQDGEPGLGRVGNLPKSLTKIELVSHLKEVFKRQELPVMEAQERSTYQRIALIGGSGSEPTYLQAAVQQGADVFLTGDIGYHRAQLAVASNLCVIDIGHYAEAIFNERMVPILQQLAPEVEVVASTVSTNPFSYL